MGVAGIVLLVLQPSLVPIAAFAFVGFATIAVTSVMQFAVPGPLWLRIEESLSGICGVLIVGFGYARVTALCILWLVAVASGVLARGGRQYWIGRTMVVGSLLLPIAHYGHLSSEYAGFCVAAVGLLLTSGRLTRELNELLGQARREADSAETLLLAGDIASRMAGRGGRAETNLEPGAPASGHLSAEEAATVGGALARLIDGNGLAIAVQPIVDIATGEVHAYEALARFNQPGMEGSPLRWFAAAEELGQRAALERACLRAALQQFVGRPPGTSLSVNLSVPVLLDGATLAILEETGDSSPEDLHGLIVEITEETLVHGEMELLAGFEPLRARGARLAVDDVGAGYSGLRQITSVLPSYLKLDRSLVSGIDADGERAALVGALVGYSQQVDCMLVAEGIETAAELEAVQRLGAPLAQGFLLARPGPPWPAVSDVPGLLGDDRQDGERAAGPSRRHGQLGAPARSSREVALLGGANRRRSHSA